MGRMLRLATLSAVLPLLLGLAPGGLPPGPGGLAAHRADHGVTERSVAFEVVNHNRSATATQCQGDGQVYTVRGSLVGPPGVNSGAIDAVTLYVHGSGDGSTWHFTAVPGVDHITEMARLGHASVFLHLLGYGPSDPVDGSSVCYGAYADHVAQVIGHLRAGTYLMDRGPGLAFERVALAGHSSGGLIAELASVSFHVADALIVAGWTDYPWQPTVPDDGEVVHSHHPFLYRAYAGFVQRCATAPESKQAGEPGGWAYIFTTRAEFEMLAPNADPRVLDPFIDQYEQDPCGQIDGATAIAANVALAPTVDVPVLLANGDRDPVASPAAVELQRARYERGNPDVSSLIIADSGHQIMFERPARAFRAGLSSWLTARGF